MFGAHVNSTGIGYEANIPAGWHLTPNVIQGPNFRGDAYFKNDPGTPDPNRAATNISVGCQPKSPETGTLDDQLALELKGLQQLKRENITSADRAPVDGKPAKQIDFVYRLNASGPTPVPPTPAPPSVPIVIDQRQVLVVSDDCIWKITLSTPQGTVDAETPVLDAFLGSLKLHA